MPIRTYPLQILKRSQRFLQPRPDDRERDESRGQAERAPTADHQRLNDHQQDAHDRPGADDEPQRDGRPRHRAPPLGPTDEAEHDLAQVGQSPEGCVRNNDREKAEVNTSRLPFPKNGSQMLENTPNW
jgi:hypothetical protein